MKLNEPTHTLNLTTPDRIAFANEPVRFQPVGRCIYCTDVTGPLGEEHIVPYAIARNSLVLPAASCRKCEAITGRYEQAVLRRTMGNVRLRFDAPTRNKKNRKPTLLLSRAKVEYDNQSGQPSIGAAVRAIEVSASSAPMFYISLRVGPPGILQGLPLGTHLEWNSFYTCKVGDIAEDLAINGVAVEIGQFNPYLYAQFLAKMAYSYAVAKLGDGTFWPLILDLVLGKTMWFRHWVGGEPQAPPADENEIHQISHHIRTVGDHKYIVVRIRLFSFLGTPVYDVVVGEIL